MGDMPEFTDFESLYSHLEEAAQNYEHIHQIANLFQKLRDLKHKAEQLEESQKAQWEIDFFSFDVRRAKLSSMFSGTNENGEIFEYPSFDRFDDGVYDHLSDRLNTTTNPLLKSRYAHILWESPRRHVKYGTIAVQSYLELIKVYETKDKEAPTKHYGLRILSSIESAFVIACNTKQQLAEVKSEIIRLLKEFNLESSSSFALRMNLIRLMLKNKRRFPNENFVGVADICWQIAESLKASDNVHASIDMLELGNKVELKLGQEARDWRRQIAVNYETLMEEAIANSNLAAGTFCQYALQEYKRLKDKAKVSEIEKKYVEIKESQKLGKIETEIDLTEHVQACRDIADNIVKNAPPEIIEFLMFNKDILPKYEDMKIASEKHSEEFVVQHIIPMEVFDQNGNVAQHFSEDDEKEYFNILQQYTWDLELNKIYLINSIFFAAIRENKLSANELLTYLNTKSWFGKNLSRASYSSDEPITYNWLSLIAPAFHDYFLQLHYFFISQANPPSLVLAIDSLTLKIEGLFRDLCRFVGVTSFFQTTDTKGRTITREKDIHALLHEEKVKELFDADDLLFFKYLLVEKAGYNLRHRVAHSLMLFQEYGINYFHLLILAVLKLGKYDFTKAK